jgi:hypothetical protein
MQAQFEAKFPASGKKAFKLQGRVTDLRTVEANADELVMPGF